MIDDTLRSAKERLLAPLARGMGQVPPARITWTGFVLGLLACASAACGHAYLALALWLGNRLGDGLDGCVARRQGTHSDWGGYLDVVLDLVVYALLPLSLVLARPSEAAWLTLALLLTAFYVNVGSWMYLAAVLEKRGVAGKRMTSIRMPGGLIEGAETVVFYCLFLLFPGALPIMFATMAMLVGVTTAQRMVWAARTLGGD